MEWYLKVLRQYADFDGRARRKEYWMFVLFDMLFMIGFMIFMAIIAGITKTESLFMIGMMLLFVYLIGTIIPRIAVIVRRLHDTNNSGWMYFVSIIPLIGSIWLLVLMCQEGDYGDNAYGSDPKTERYESELSELGNDTRRY